METENKIYLRFNDVGGKRECFLTGFRFQPDFLAFYYNNELDKPISESAALRQGFTMTTDDFLYLKELVSKGLINKGLKI